MNSKISSYADIAEKVGMERSGVFYALVYPWRTTLETYLMLAGFFGYPIEKAKAEWKDSKLAKVKELLFLDDGVYEKSFRDIKPENLTFGYLATRIGLSKSTVESICYNPAMCSWKAICKLLDFLNLNRDDYYDSWKYAVYQQKKKAIEKQI